MRLYKGDTFEEMLQRSFLLSFSNSKQSINAVFKKCFSFGISGDLLLLPMAFVLCFRIFDLYFITILPIEIFKNEERFHKIAKSKDQKIFFM